jgi:hypothetical protein
MRILPMTGDPPPSNPHFLPVGSWVEAAEHLDFEPRQPRMAGLGEPTLSIYVLDHKRRELPIGRRSLEAHYADFVLSQTRCGPAEAVRRALRLSYGITPREAEVAGHPARAYELGEATWPPDDDGPPPAVLTWHDGGMHFVVASYSVTLAELEPIAASMYG